MDEGCVLLVGPAGARLDGRRYQFNGLGTAHQPQRRSVGRQRTFAGRNGDPWGRIGGRCEAVEPALPAPMEDSATVCPELRATLMSRTDIARPGCRSVRLRGGRVPAAETDRGGLEFVRPDDLDVDVEHAYPGGQSVPGP